MRECGRCPLPLRPFSKRPLCDGSHEKAEFRAEGARTEAQVSSDKRGESKGGELLIRAADPGPLMIKGSAEIRGDRAASCTRVGALCCCGKSKNRPFCDGSHAA